MTSRLPARTRQWIARVFLSAAAIVMPACHLPLLRQADTSAPLPASYTGATNSEAVLVAVAKEPTGAENSALLGVQEFYGDPALNQLIAQVMAGNRDLKIMDEEIQIAGNEVLARRGAYLPFVSFGASAGLEKPGRYTRNGAVEEQLEIAPGRRFPNPLPNYQLGLNLFMPVDIWREYRNARDAAVQRYLAAIERRNDLVTRLIAQTAENYYRLLALDKRIENLDQIIAIQEKSLELARSRKAAARDTELPVQRFQAEVRRNQSEKWIVRQEIVETENRINVLANRPPQSVERNPAEFENPSIRPVNLGVPAQLLVNRPDIRQAERELVAADLDVLVARARFFPRLDISASVGWEAFNPRYLFVTPESLAYNLVGNLVVPIVNRAAIRADYQSANARQLQAIYNYQQTVLTAYAEVINWMSLAENSRRSIEVRREQLKALQTSVDVATKLFQNARVEYVEVLLAQRDLLETQNTLIQTRSQQLTALVNVYQSLGGGNTYFLPPLLPIHPLTKK